MKNKFFGSHLMMGMFVFLCLSWVSFAVKAQTSDSIVFVKPQPAEIITWTTHKPKKQLPRAVLKLDAGYGWRTATIIVQLTAVM